MDVSRMSLWRLVLFPWNSMRRNRAQFKIPMTVILLTLLAVVAVGCQSKQHSLEGARIKQSLDLRAGEQAPDFRLSDMRGNLRNLSEFDGRPIVLHFWSPWCSTCLPEMQALQSLRDRVGSEVSIITISVGADPADVSRYLLVHHLNLTVLLDNSSARVAELYQVGLLPVTFILNAEHEFTLFRDPDGGIERFRFDGPRGWVSSPVVEALKALNQ